LSESHSTASHVPPEPHLPHGWKQLAFDELDSTNAALVRMVEQGVEVDENLLLWAKSQTAGKGRQGRTWVSPPGNVYASYLLAAPENKAAAPEIGFVAAIAVFDAICDLPRHNTAPPPLQCKWPNDVLLDGGKVSGILPEMLTGPDGRSWLVLGIGINLESMPTEATMYPPTALILHHIDSRPEHALTVLSRALAFWLEKWRAEGFEIIRHAWLERGPHIGTPVSVGLQSGTVEGTFAGLDTNGALLLDTPTGQRRILAGDVLLRTN